MPEFMTPRMRETIGANVLWPEHTAKIKSHLARSETACDDTHQFTPSRFDMEHAMRINLDDLSQVQYPRNTYPLQAARLRTTPGVSL